MKVRDIVMREDAKITKSDGSGVEITADDGVKTTLPADKASAIMPDPEKPGEYDFNPQAVAQPASGQPEGPKVGANVEIKTAEAASETMTMPTTEYVKGIYAAAAENGMDTPEVEEVKKQMVLAPNGEVDILATMQKALQVFQSPEWKQFLADLDALIKKAEAQAPNPELARIQELSGMTDEDTVSPRFNGYQQTKHDNGDTTDDYSAGPVALKTRKDAAGNTISADAQYELGPNTIKMNQNQVGVKTIGATGPQADQFVGTDASAQRKGVDPTKFAAFKQQAGVQESAELTAMLKIAGLR